MTQPLYIYGAGGFGREVLSMTRAIESWEVKGFLDDGVEEGTKIRGVEVIGGRNVLSELPTDAMLILGIGDPLVKRKLIDTIGAGRRYATLIHPAAIIQDSESVRIGEGSIICAGTILTTNIEVGSHVLLNLNCTVGHDTSIGDYSSIMPGVNIAGEVSIEDSVLLGSGCNIRNRVTIHSAARVGMGAVVLNDAGAGTTVVGIPARPINR